MTSIVVKIDGRAMAQDPLNELRPTRMALEPDDLPVGLAVVLASNDYAARSYERRLRSLAAKPDVSFVCETLPERATGANTLAGVPSLVGADHISEGAIAIDVVINAVTDPTTAATTLVGDIAADSIAARAEAYSPPAPGGVGPITDVWLHDTLNAARQCQFPVGIQQGDFEK